MPVYHCATIQKRNVRNLMTAHLYVYTYAPCYKFKSRCCCLLKAGQLQDLRSRTAQTRDMPTTRQGGAAAKTLFSHFLLFFLAYNTISITYNATIVTNCSSPLSIARPRRAAALGRAAPRRARLLSSAIGLGFVICNAVLDLGLSSTVSNPMRLPGRSRSITSLATTIPLTKPPDERASASLLPFSSPATHQTKFQQYCTDINEASCSSLKLALDAQIHTFRIGLVPN
jgi:hypothetical protein